MKKTIIGSVVMLSGVIILMSIIIAAVVYLPSITSWSGSRLWYAIFGAEHYENEVVQSLNLGFLFAIGILMAVVGLIILFS